MSENPTGAGDAHDASIETQVKSSRIATYMGRITLYDPDPDDVSRADRPLVPDAPTVKAVQDAVERVLGDLGYAANVTLTRTDE